MTLPCPAFRSLFPLLSSFLLATAFGQDPVIKPTPVEPLSRLPAPIPVTARQLPDGRIEVRWPTVDGAVKYQVTRSVPPDPARVLQPDPAVPLYIDSDVTQGRTYYYVVAAYNAQGTLGLKSGSPPVTATLPLGGATADTLGGLPSNFRAELLAPNRVRLTWTSPALVGTTTYATVERIEVSASGTNVATVGRFALRTASFDDTFNLPGVTQLTYRMKVDGQGATPLHSNTIALTTDTTNGTGGSTGTPSTTTAASFSGTTTLTVAPAISLRVGQTAALTAAGTGARWLSMNETLATVDALGTVTARAAGNAQLVALTGASDGSLRVTTVGLVITP